jgi:hypothetical protein
MSRKNHEEVFDNLFPYIHETYPTSRYKYKREGAHTTINLRGPRWIGRGGSQEQQQIASCSSAARYNETTGECRD